MLSCLEQVRAALLTVTNNVNHYEAMKRPNKYVVWAESGESSSQQADNIKTKQAIEGTIDYYTKDDDDTAPDRFQAAFNAAGIAWKLNSVQYEDATRYIHYEWLFRVMNEP